MRIRYIAPILPPLVILTVYGAHDLVRAAGGLGHAGLRRGAYGCLGGLALWFLLPNGQYILNQFIRVQPLSYLSGAVSREAYIQQYRPEYAVISHANRHLPRDAKILGLFLGNRIYHSDRQLVDNIGLFSALVKGFRTPADLQRKLQGQGYSHLLVRYDLFERWAKDNYNQQQQETLRIFFQSRVKMVANLHGYGLLDLAGAD